MYSLHLLKDLMLKILEFDWFIKNTDTKMIIFSKIINSNIYVLNCVSIYYNRMFEFLKTFMSNTSQLLYLALVLGLVIVIAQVLI